MLRGFWLAVGALAVLCQWLLIMLSEPGTHVPNGLFTMAWGAAALYAVGAAATLFAVEHEEETHTFLQGLPVVWKPVFIGKIVLTAVSSVGLAAALSLIGWLISGTLPHAATMTGVVGLFGFAIIEASAWGTFFSLLLKRPLLAALLSIALTSIAVQLLTSMVNSGAASLSTIDSYTTALPIRLLIVAIVFAVDIRMAWHWLTPEKSLSPKLKQSSKVEGTARVDTHVKEETATANSASRRAMVARLVWQTWQESWRTMLAAVPLALVTMFAISLPMGVVMSADWHIDLPLPLLTALFLPALSGALVFRADQRRKGFRFLVDHAAPHRYVWIVRHAAWLTALVVVGIVLQLVGLGAIAVLFGRGLELSLRDGWFSNYHGTEEFTKELLTALGGISQASAVGWSAILAAYAVGQLCSMIVRSEILAGFLSLLLSMVLSAWVLVVFLWNLNPVWFILPLVVGAMLATWFRAPDWLTERNHLRTWWKPATATILPLVLIAVELPSARLSLLDIPIPKYPFLQEPLDASVKRYQANHKTGRMTADEYQRLVATLKTPWVKSTQDELLPDTEIIDDQAYLEANKPAIQKLIKLSKLPHCAFPPEVELGGNHLFHQVNTLKELLHQETMRMQKAGELDSALELHLAALRMRGHLTGFQPTFLLYDFSRRSSEYRSLIQWAAAPGQTSDRIRKAMVQLDECHANWPNPRDAILTDYQQIRDVLLGSGTPIFLENENRRWSRYLTYLANELPWERERAFVALDHLVTQSLNYIDVVNSSLTHKTFDMLGAVDGHKLRRLVREVPVRGPAVAEWSTRQYGEQDSFHDRAHIARQSKTSYLVTQELNERLRLTTFLHAMVGTETLFRGTKLQLALIAYRLDHSEYPQALSALVPDYLNALPKDPCADDTFRYRPHGFHLQLDDQVAGGGSPVPANAPLFWSVGAGNCVPSKKTIEVINPEDQDLPPEEQQTHTEPAFQFIPTEHSGHWWNWGTSTVFPLPK